MRFRAACCGVVLAALMAADAVAAVRISNDKGGQIGPYLDAYLSLRKSGQRVIIDGPCLSACTIVVGIMPRDRICVTRRARLGFHAAWNPGHDGRPVLSHAGTKALWDLYPGQIRSWLKKRGGLKPRMVFLSGSELMAMFRVCD
ncbi:MAG: hypothetical protein AB7V13_14565 [Pseudorhodoplanes sp.]|uniref:hypothetical protein n=1 Tax=Pseudorhodoplanes sp. TaxID=1934341 RepID=UPI003D096DE8